MSTPTNPNLGTIASSVTSSFTQLAKLVIASAYLAGLGFSIGAIVKFKEHMDNSTQIPLGTPFALEAVSAALTFLPAVTAKATSA